MEGRDIATDHLTRAVQPVSECRDTDLLLLHFSIHADSGPSKRLERVFEGEDFLRFEQFSAVQLFGAVQGAFPKTFKSIRVNRKFLHILSFLRRPATSLKNRNESFS